MNFDDLQQAWQRDAAAASTPSVDPQLLAQVRRGSRDFALSIFWRDVREVGAAVLVAGVFGKVALDAQAEGSPAWPAWVAAVLPLLVAAFMLLDRWVMRRRTAAQGDTLVAELERAAAAVRHQIWLLRNVLWWYLLPLGASVFFLMAQFAWYAPTAMPAFLKWIVASIVLIPTGWFDWWVWKLNQKAVREDLQPRLDQLEQQRAELR